MKIQYYYKTRPGKEATDPITSEEMIEYSQINILEQAQHLFMDLQDEACEKILKSNLPFCRTWPGIFERYAHFDAEFQEVAEDLMPAAL